MARRATKACSSCHTRKTRCDANDVGLPCTKCKADGFQCVIEPKKKRRSRIRVRDVSSAIPEPRVDFPEHVLRHQMPHYAFFRNFAVVRRPQPLSPSKRRGLILPIVPRDEAADVHNSSPSAFTEDMRFLKLKGAFDLPPKHIMDECISTYFRVFHPFFPVIDRPSFLALYEQSAAALLQGKGPSLLLLQAIIFIAVASIQMEYVEEMGFTSRLQARSSFHTRARYLHQFDYESDDIITIQALLLMSHYYPSIAEQKHTWYWAHQAIGLVQGAGLHRDCGPIPERRLWGRIWWCCLVRDRLISLGTNRPMHINSLHCSVPLPTALDLEEEQDTQDDLTIKAMFVDFVKLCYYIEGVLSLPYVAPDSLRDQISVCEATLQSWAANLSPPSRRGSDSTITPTHNSLPLLYRTLLHLIYNVVLMTVLQSGSTMDKDRADGSRPPSPTDTRTVAIDSTELLSELLNLDLVKYLPTQSVTVVLPTLIVQMQSMHYASDMNNYEFSKKRFKVCMEILRQLGQTYWHANFYHDIFQLAAFSKPNDAADQETLIQAENQSGSSRPNRPLRAKTVTQEGHGNTVASFMRDSVSDSRVGFGYTLSQGQDRISRTMQLPDPGPSVDDSIFDREADSFVLPPSAGMEASTFTGQYGDIEGQFHLFNGWFDDDTLFQSLFPSV